jgi:hypothetical protein
MLAARGRACVARPLHARRGVTRVNSCTTPVSLYARALSLSHTQTHTRIDAAACTQHSIYLTDSVLKVVVQESIPAPVARELTARGRGAGRS